MQLEFILQIGNKIIRAELTDPPYGPQYGPQNITVQWDYTHYFQMYSKGGAPHYPYPLHLVPVFVPSRISSPRCCFRTWHNLRIPAECGVVMAPMESGRVSDFIRLSLLEANPVLVNPPPPLAPPVPPRSP